MPVAFVTVRLPDASLVHLDVDLKTTVEEFRTILAPKSGIKRHKQRLVFAGKLMQDGRTLEAYGIERNSTVHLLHGGGDAGGGADAGPGIPGAGDLGGLDISVIPPHLGTVQRHVLANPDILQQMLESPAMQSLLNDHDFLRSLLKMDPRHTKLLESCPELQEMLQDQEFMSQATEALRNPVHVRDVLRSTDRSMAQLECLGGGAFDVVRQMCEDIERPKLDQPEITTVLTRKPTETTAAPGEPDEETPAAGDGASGLPPAPEWLGSFDTNAMASMMQDQNMQQLLSQLVQAMQGPTAKIHPDDPFLDPSFIGQMFHSQTIDSMTKLQLAVEQLSMTGDVGPGASATEAASPKAKAEPGGLRAKRAAAAKAAGGAAQGDGTDLPPDSPFVLSGLNPKSPAANFKEAFALFLAAEQESPEVRYKGQLQSMYNMGFTDKEACIQALHNCDGNMNRAVEELIKQGKGK
jgi:ubiquilin